MFSNAWVSRLNYLRVFLLASINLIYILPVNATIQALRVLWDAHIRGGPRFYNGWSSIHSEWGPEAFAYNDPSSTRLSIASNYITHWSSTALAFITFALFGLSAEARTSYRRMFRAVARRHLDRDDRATGNGHPTIASIEFGARQSPDLPLGTTIM